MELQTRRLKWTRVLQTTEVMKSQEQMESPAGLASSKNLLSLLLSDLHLLHKGRLWWPGLRSAVIL